MQPVCIRDGFDNNFTPLRIVMALMVVVGHAMIVAQRRIDAEPMVMGDFSVSYMAVNAFFVASGFLVTASMIHRRDVLEFAVARVLRIYPALVVHVLLVMFVVGLATTTLPAGDYLTHGDVWKQIPLVLSFVSTDFLLPGVFEDNYEQYASAPLWTLRFELLAYLGTGVAFALGLMRHRWMIAVQFVGFALAWPVVHVLGLWDTLPGTAQNILRFGLAYGFGAMVWAYRDELPFRWWVVPVCALALFMAMGRLVDEILFNVMIGYAVFLLAYAKALPWKMPDVSCGIYIYHWPILQWLKATNPDMGTTMILLVTVPATILVAWLSWHIVEKPMLARKASVTRWLRERVRKARPTIA